MWRHEEGMGLTTYKIGDQSIWQFDLKQKDTKTKKVTFTKLPEITLANKKALTIRWVQARLNEENIQMPLDVTGYRSQIAVTEYKLSRICKKFRDDYPL